MTQNGRQTLYSFDHPVSSGGAHTHELNTIDFSITNSYFRIKLTMCSLLYDNTFFSFFLWRCIYSVLKYQACFHCWPAGFMRFSFLPHTSFGFSSYTWYIACNSVCYLLGLFNYCLSKYLLYFTRSGILLFSSVWLFYVFAAISSTLLLCAFILLLVCISKDTSFALVLSFGLVT